MLIPGPAHRIRLPGSPYIKSVAFAPDGRTFYVHINERDANVWVTMQYYGIDASAFIPTVDRILEFDVPSGRIRRTLITRPDLRDTECELVCTPDGAGLMMLVDGTDCLALVCTRTGLIQRTLAWGDFVTTTAGRWKYGRWSQIVGFDRTGSTVYAVMHDTQHARTRLIAWNLASGAAVQLVETDSDPALLQIGIDRWPRRFYRGSSPSSVFIELPHPLAVSGPGLMGSGTILPANMVLRDGDSPDRVIGRVEVKESATFSLGVSGDGRRVYLPNSPRRDLVFYDLDASTAPPTSCSPRGMSVDLCVATFAGVPRMVTDSIISIPPGMEGHSDTRIRSLARQVASDRRRGRGFAIFELDHGNVIGFCVRPSGFQPERIFGAATGRFFAAEGYYRDRKNDAGSYARDLLIYDLGAIPAP